MKKIALILILLLGGILVSCMEDQLVPEEMLPRKEEGWRVALEASKGESAATKSVEEDGWEEDAPVTKSLSMPDESHIYSYWSGTEKVEMYDGNTYKCTLYAMYSGGNSTTMSGTLSEGAMVGDRFQLYYPCKPSGGPLYAGQKGTVADISANYDYAVASVEVTSVDASSGTISLSQADFVCRQSISLFEFNYATVNTEGIVKLTITAPHNLNGGPITVVPETPATRFFVAIPKFYDGPEKLVYSFVAETESGLRYEGTKRACLQAGKYYKTTVQLAKYDPIATPLTIEALEDGTITIRNPRNLTILYNAEGQGFTHMSTVYAYANPIVIPVSAGQRVILGGKNDIYGSIDSNSTLEEDCVNITCNAEHYIYGNVMSLVDWQYYTAPELHTPVQTAKDRAFAYLFAGDDQLYSHPVKTIELPAMTVQYAAYLRMFCGCSNLTIAPELPATTLAATGSFPNGCYAAMFKECTSLVKAPSILPAMTLRSNCYTNMFYKCASLTASPVLPAKTLAEWSYSNMFDGCSSLQQITCYATNISAKGCLSNWTHGVSPTGMFISDPSASWPSGDHGIPAGWNGYVEPLTLEAIGDGIITISNPQKLSITWGKSASMASATTSSLNPITISVTAGDKVRLWGDNARYGGDEGAAYLNTNISSTAAHYAYGDIRSLISSSNYPNVTTLADYAFTGLFQSDTGLRSHAELKLNLGATTVGDFSCMGMFSGCTGLVRAPILPATTLGEQCYDNMFSGCSWLTGAPVLPATTLAAGCYGAMFSGCTSLVTAPALPAATLTEGCYMNMFDYCISLTSAPALNAATLVSSCYSYMFRDCVSLNAVTCLATNPSLSDYEADPQVFGNVDDWLQGTAATGTLTIKSGVVWPSGTYPSGWTLN